MCDSRAVQHVQPPYKQGDDPTTGLKCYLCPHVVTGSWEAVWNHVSKHHEVKKADIADTFFLRVANDAKNNRAKTARDTKPKQTPKQKPKQTPTQSDPKLDQEQVPMQEPMQNGPGDEHIYMSDAAGGLAANRDGKRWKAYWVSVLPSGDIAEPTVMYPCLPGDSVPESTAASQASASCSCAAASAGEEREPFASRHALEASGPGVPSGASLGGASSPDLASPVSSSQLSQLVGKIDQVVQSLNVDKQAWKQELPVLRVAPGVAECILPSAKGEGGARRANWPKELRCPTFEIDDFTRYYWHTKVAKFAGDGHMRNMQRVFGLVEVQTGDGWTKIETAEQAADVKLAVAFLMGDVYASLLDMPLMDVKFSFAENIVGAMVAFFGWQVQVMADKIIQGEDGHWERYSGALHRLTALLQGGYAKRLSIAKAKKVIAKVKEDTKTINRLPPVSDMRAAVEQGYRILKGISERYCNCFEALPRNVQGAANACLVGAIWLGGFGGRKYEWEVMTLEHVVAQLASDIDFLPCPEHKTSRTYGTLAKWLPPGALQAVRCYVGLPRPPGVETFLVPAGRATERVSIPSALRTFVAHLLAKDTSKPTVNIMRKFFHRALRKATKTEEQLKQVMTVLDGHGRDVIDRHYALRDPEDDVALAKILVNVVLGTTAVWPEGPVTSDGHEIADMWSGFQSEIEDETAEKLSEEDDEDIDLEWFPFAGLFGVTKPLHAVCNLEYDSIAAELGPVPIADVSFADVSGEPGAGRSPVEHLPNCFGSPAKKQHSPMLDTAASITTKAPKDKKDKKDKHNKKDKKDTKDKEDKEDRKDKEDENGKPDKKAGKYLAVKKVHLKTLAVSGRRTALDPDDKVWIEHEHQMAPAKNAKGMASTKWFSDAVERGIREGRLSRFATAAGLRSHIRFRAPAAR